MAGIALMMLGCKQPTPPGSDPTPTPPAPKTEKETTHPEGLSTGPEKAEADKALTLTFVVPKGSPLYDEKGDLYAHIGIVQGGDWQHVPAEWTTNIDKCKWTKVKDHTWQLKLEPTVRKWFGAEKELVISKIGLVIRNADGSKKAYDQDLFIPVRDQSVSHPEVVREALPEGIKEGITLSPDGSVTLALSDRDKEQKSLYDHAYVVGDFSDWKRSADYAMKRDEARGLWWITLKGLSKGEHLMQYHLFSDGGDNILIADPYSTKVLSPDDKYLTGVTPYPAGKTSGYVTTFTIGKEAYPWEVKDFKAPRQEELLIYEMHLRDFTREGNLSGAMKELDRIREMGFNAIEVMPVQEFTGNDSWGYNPIFYFALDKAYGSEEEYKAFVDACHRQGLAVILDVVYNHMDSPSPLYRLFPIDRSPYFNKEAPHPYSVFHDLDHSSRATRELVERSLRYLLEEYRVDGFRFDLSKGFTQRHSTEATCGQYDKGRIEILTGYLTAMRKVSPRVIAILEHFCEEKEEQELAASGFLLWHNVSHPFQQATMGYKEKSSFVPLYRTYDLHRVAYMESHDEERLAAKQRLYGVPSIKSSLKKSIDRLALATAFFLTSPGPKMVWQYGEYGYSVSIDEGGRTGRKPVWGSQELSKPDRKRLADTYSALLRLRERETSFFDGKGDQVTTEVDLSHWRVRSVSIRDEKGRKLLVVGNFDPLTDGTTTLPSGTWDDLLTPEREAWSGGKELPLRPGHFLVLGSF